MFRLRTAGLVMEGEGMVDGGVGGSTVVGAKGVFGVGS